MCLWCGCFCGEWSLPLYTLTHVSHRCVNVHPLPGEQEKTIDQQRQRFEVGLDKLKTTEVDVQQLQNHLIEVCVGCCCFADIVE